MHACLARYALTDRAPAAPRFVKFGGGLSAAQLAWLQGQLEEAAAAGERVVAACHLVFHPGTAPPTCLLWNYDEVLQVRHVGRWACWGRRLQGVRDRIGATETCR